MKELIEQYPPADVLRVYEQLDAQQRSWLISKIAEDLDHNTLAMLKEMKITAALQAFVQAELAERGL